ncbi:MAG TPA: hypothetical protein VEF06_14150 [Bryobacteraceae bacterium]|nr:hypothetical protein [Bryobacteraceae bacterium]
MQEVEFRIPRDADLRRAEQLIEEACAALNLTPAMKGALASYPGSTHWHYKNGKEKGTLELTLSPRDRRIWAQVQSRRKAPWIDTLLREVQGRIERALKTSPDTSTRPTSSRQP